MTRLILPVDRWPHRDQRAWERARSKGDVLAPQGRAASWRAKTVKQILKSYGMWLQWLADHDLLEQEVSPSQRATSSRLLAYRDALSKRVAPETVVSRLSDLDKMLAAIDEAWNAGDLKKILRRLRYDARPTRIKHPLMRHPREILDCGLTTMDKAFAGDMPKGRKQAVRYRDGLMVALLIVVPIRLGNLTALRIGRDIVRHQNGYVITLEGQDTKNGRSYEAPVLPELTSYIDRYLRVVRPSLLKDRVSDALWVSYRAGPVAENTVREHVKLTTKAFFGVALHPHLFRDCAATFLATHDPEHVMIAAPLLHHANFKTTERHYNQASMRTAVRSFHDGLASRMSTPDPQPSGGR